MKLVEDEKYVFSSGLISRFEIRKFRLLVGHEIERWRGGGVEINFQGYDL